VYVTGITYSTDFPRIATNLPLPAADPRRLCGQDRAAAGAGRTVR